MFKKLTVSAMLVIVLLLSACGGAPAIIPTSVLNELLTAAPTLMTTLQPTVVIPTQGQLPTVALPTVAQPTVAQPTQAQATAAPAATSTAPQPTAAQGSGSLPDISSAAYLDDRSTPAAVMLSYFNAINRHEYLRAYSYYTNYTMLGTLDQLTKGYSDTQSVSVSFGSIYGEGAAGSVYYTVPMVLNATLTNGTQQKYAACYVLRLAQPANFGAPPIVPMHIERGTAKSVALTTADASALASACPSADYPTGGQGGTAQVEATGDISSANYIDNRSDPVTVISSLMNAINRKEYVRAYAYWQNPPHTYADFAAGYAKTASVTVQFGTATPDAGAGQIYYALPVALKTTMTDGNKQTFVGCYTLHISQPSVQATPPFKGLGIYDASVKQVDNNADIAALLAKACQ